MKPGILEGEGQQMAPQGEILIAGSHRK